MLVASEGGEWEAGCVMLANGDGADGAGGVGFGEYAWIWLYKVVAGARKRAAG